MIINVSVIICTYNSEDRIIETLKHLQLQKTNLFFEVIIVNNNSTDNTITKSLNYWNLQQSIHPLKIVEELNQGLSFARKAGVLEASGEVIIFCDDDNSFCDNYIEYCYNYLINNLNIGAMCSSVVPKSNIELPYWFSTYQSNYACGVFSLNSADVTDKGWIWGAGLAMRRALISGLYTSGFNNFATDRNKKVLSSGGDVELCKWIILCGYKLWYDENIYLIHNIAPERLTKEYVIKFNSDINTKDLHYSYDIIIGIKNNIFIETLFRHLFLMYKSGITKSNIDNLNIFVSALLFKLGIKRNDFYNNIITNTNTYSSNFLDKK
jgi:glycosyltransferase involved in cell wall biosynthesis